MPFLVVGLFVGIDEGPDFVRAALARMGSAASVSGEPRVAFGRLLDKGSDPRAAVAVRRFLDSDLPKDAVRGVVVERFQKWTSRTPASYQLGMVGARAVPLLTDLLEHDKERVRQQAALALGDIGLAAVPALPALEKLAGRSPPDLSSRAATNALGDVAPAGVRGWLWKFWYEIPFLPLFVIVLAPLVIGVLYPRLLAQRDPRENPLDLVPPAWFPVSVGFFAAIFFAFALFDLCGERFTVEADVWALALGAWCAGACSFSIWLGRRAAGRKP
ncbi:MAG: HEAT repeat domain-containing protein [Acidobacteriota bacterium]|nr:HEAT repeat domain-containing protein [Acidobacteriota bacterium]